MITAGEVIKNKRESLGKSLDDVSLDTHIQKRFLQYIEDNQYDKFDSEIFATGFLKIYSKYLGLDVEKVLALYRRSNLKEFKTDKKTKEVIKKKKVQHINISPKLIAIFTLSLFLLLIVGYVGYQIYKFQTPPPLVVLEPSNEYVSKEETLLLKGTTQPTVLVDINGVQVVVDENGNFESTLTLVEGVNTINVKATKASNTRLETKQTIKVIYAPEIDTMVEEETKEFLLTLSISQSPSWIKLDIDNVNQISQVLQPNTIHEFEVKETLSLVTGRVQNTTISINGETIPIPSENQTGIGQIQCQIVQEELKCE